MSSRNSTRKTGTRWRSAIGAAALSALALSPLNVNAVPVPGGTLDPLSIPKYVTPLVIPPVLFDDLGNAMEVEIALRQINQQVLPTSGCQGTGATCVNDSFPATPLWAYGNPADLTTFNNPGFTVEVTKDTETKVKWTNALVDESGTFLPHVIKDQNGVPIVDQTLHWAAPNQDCLDGIPRTDCRGASDQPYLGPIPMVMHVHGAHVGPGSDGYPEAWWLPNGAAAGIDCTNVADYPATPDPADDFACNGTFFESEEGTDTANAIGQGYAIDVYPNDQPTTTLWYHDHSLGMTRLNVYAAGAGFWMIRDDDPTTLDVDDDLETGVVSGSLPGPAPKVNDSAAALNTPGDPVRSAVREIPIAIQPKSFNADGSQYYPADRAFFEGLGDGGKFALNTEMTDGAGGPFPFLPQSISDIAPVWNPEAFFNTMVVNGSTWPQLEVAPERYRFRFVNASDSRFMNLALFIVKNNNTYDGELPFYQIGSEQGLLPQVVRIETGLATTLPGDGRDGCGGSTTNDKKKCVARVPGTFADQALLLGPAERPDVIVDFSGLKDGTIVRMINTGPDAPFGGFPDVPADPSTTGQVMQFVVNSALIPVATNPDGSPVLDKQGNPVPRTDPSTHPADLVLDANPGGVPKLGVPTAIQDLALLEEESALLCVTVDALTGVIDLVPGDPAGSNVPPTCDQGGVPFGPKAAVLGINGSGGGTVQLWDDDIAQNPALNSVEEWELWNWSADAHPIHLHLVKFEVVNRQVIGGAVRPPEPWETGWKDTVIAYPGEVTRVKALFDIPGLYVWHCHILSHEDNEMMVPYCVGVPGVDCPSELFPPAAPAN